MPLERHDEHQLIHRARQGDQNAFNTLIETHCRRVKGYIAGRLFYQKHEVEDILQETCEYAWKKISTYDLGKGSTFFSWILIWADICLKRYGNQIKKYREIHVSLSPFIPNEDESDCDWLGGTEDPGFQQLEMAQEHLVILGMIFQTGGYPWQLICYGYNKLLPEWTPQTIVSRLGESHTLQELARLLEEEYLAEMGCGSELTRDIQKCFHPLHASLKLVLNELIKPNDQTTRVMIQNRNLAMTRAGETRLTDYWGSNPASNITDWCYRVRKKTLRNLMEGRR